MRQDFAKDGWNVRRRRLGIVGGTNHVIELFSSKGQACRGVPRAHPSLIHSFIHCLSAWLPQCLTDWPTGWLPADWPGFVCAQCWRSIFIPKTILGPDVRRPDDRQPSTSCSFVSAYIAGIQFLFITHSAAKLFLNCPYQLRNEIYYLACVYRQCPVSQSESPRTSGSPPPLRLSVCICACPPHHYQAESELELESSLGRPSRRCSYSYSPSFIDIISFVRRADNVLYIYLILHSLSDGRPLASLLLAEEEAMTIYLRVRVREEQPRQQQPSVISDFLCQFTQDQSLRLLYIVGWDEPANLPARQPARLIIIPCVATIDQKTVCFSFPCSVV